MGVWDAGAGERESEEAGLQAELGTAAEGCGGIGACRCRSARKRLDSKKIL